jgi:hypothetical protein
VLWPQVFGAIAADVPPPSSDSRVQGVTLVLLLLLILEQHWLRYNFSKLETLAPNP